MNERQIIDMLNTMTGNLPEDLLCGIGDDCAVIAKDSSRSWLVTMDSLVESVHFDPGWHPPYQLGCKSVAVNVSDIAAMGGRARFIFLSLGLPAGYDPGWLEQFGKGISDACSLYGAVLGGGDTVRSREGILVTLTVIGEAQTGDIVYRSGARTGESVWVSGVLGSAAAGLQLCRRGLRDETRFAELVQAHLDPRPRVDLGPLLAEQHLVNSMQDLSDGLATDLAHICRRSRVGALIETQRLPVASSLREAAQLLRQDALEMMLAGGEDYELLFTAGPENDAAILALGAELAVPVCKVGRTDAKQGVRMLERDKSGNPVEVDISYGGFDHFAADLSSNGTI